MLLNGEVAHGNYAKGIAIFTSAFTNKTGLQKSQILVGKNWNKEDTPLVEEGEVRAYTSKLDICNSVGPNGRYPGLPRKLDDAIVRPADNSGFVMVTGRSA